MAKSETQTKIRTLEQVSAGGIAFRLKNSEREIAIVSVRPSLRWQLPKGLIDAGETKEQAAIREVREEAEVEETSETPPENKCGSQHEVSVSSDAEMRPYFVLASAQVRRVLNKTKESPLDIPALTTTPRKSSRQILFASFDAIRNFNRAFARRVFCLEIETGADECRNFSKF